ncbi:MAG: hypothetical protein AB7Q00_12735 [Phycisphaerales bacterium]
MRCETNSGTARATPLGTAWVRAAIGCALGFLAIAGQALAQTPAFELIEPSAGFTKTQVYDIADDGTIVAMSYNGSAPDNSPIIRYSPGGVRVEYPTGRAPRISGDGLVVGYNAEVNAFAPALVYPDGSQRLSPGVLYQGEVHRGGFEFLSRDGSVTMMTTAAGLSDRTTYRWNVSTNTTSLPPFPGGSTFNIVTGLSSDGRIAVGNWAPSSASTDRPWVWEDGGPALSPLTDPNGAPIVFGQAATISGDGRSIYANGYVIRDGVATMWDSGSIIQGIFPTDASYDGSVLVGDPTGMSWIWTQATGAVRAREFLLSHGVHIDANIGLTRLLVSNDGLHFAGSANVPGIGIRGFVATIPAPSVTSSLVCAGAIATVSGRRRKKYGDENVLADINMDGVVDMQDVVEFTNGYATPE